MCQQTRVLDLMPIHHLLAIHASFAIFFLATNTFATVPACTRPPYFLFALQDLYRGMKKEIHTHPHLEDEGNSLGWISMTRSYGKSTRKTLECPDHTRTLVHGCFNQNTLHLGQTCVHRA